MRTLFPDRQSRSMKRKCDNDSQTLFAREYRECVRRCKVHRGVEYTPFRFRHPPKLVFEESIGSMRVNARL